MLYQPPWFFSIIQWSISIQCLECFPNQRHAEGEVGPASRSQAGSRQSSERSPLRAPGPGSLPCSGLPGLYVVRGLGLELHRQACSCLGLDVSILHLQTSGVNLYLQLQVPQCVDSSLWRMVLPAGAQFCDPKLWQNTTIVSSFEIFPASNVQHFISTTQSHSSVHWRNVLSTQTEGLKSPELSCEMRFVSRTHSLQAQGNSSTCSRILLHLFFSDILILKRSSMRRELWASRILLKRSN